MDHIFQRLVQLHLGSEYVEKALLKVLLVVRRWREETLVARNVGNVVANSTLNGND